MYTPLLPYPSALPTSRSIPFSRTTTYMSDYSLPSSATRFRDAFMSAKKSGYRMPRSISVTPKYGRGSTPLSDFVPSASTRSFIRDAFDDSKSYDTRRRRSPSPYYLPRERTRDELIDSIIHTRTREHRPMPGFISASNWEERRSLKVDCDKVYPGIYLANGETIQNLDYLKRIGVTHILNTAERHVPVNPSKYPINNINYYGFHVDDHPSSNISRYFPRCNEFIDDALSRGGVVVVNCVMGWSRSATVVAAYLITKKGMTSTQALETIRNQRPIRPNPGFLQQLANFDNMLSKKLVWD